MNEGAARHVPLKGRRQITEAYADLLHRASSTVLLFENDLEHLGLDVPASVEALTRLLRASRAHRLQIVLHDTSYCEKYCARLLALQRRFSTQVEFRRTTGAARAVYDAFMVADELAFVKRFHRDQWRGEQGTDSPLQAKNLVYRFNELWEASERTLTATVIGL